jgi:hypothetical protein
MLAEPAANLRRVLDWLGLSIAEPELERLVEGQSFERLPAEHRGPGKIFRAATPGLWRENLSDEEQAVLDRVIGPKLRELGYEA